MPIATQGLLTGVLSANDLLADSGAAGAYTGIQATFWMSSSVSATIEVQHRNAANNANIWAHRMFVSATQPFCTPSLPTQIILDTGERLRVILISSLIGSVQATMFYT
jgi:hypothetical protein